MEYDNKDREKIIEMLESLKIWNFNLAKELVKNNLDDSDSLLKIDPLMNTISAKIMKNCNLIDDIIKKI